MNKALSVIGFLSVVMFVCTFVYHVFSYPDAPIRSCDEGAYCGRGGHLYGQQDHDDFWMLAYSLVVMFLVAALSFAIANRASILGDNAYRR